jgi:hypothetical protein
MRSIDHSALSSDGCRNAGLLAQERQAEHPMASEIVAIDHDTSVVLAKTEPVPMTVHFPNDQVQDLEAGDTITIHLSFEKGQKQ